MDTKIANQKSKIANSLIELLGVLAIIAILVCLFLPRTLRQLAARPVQIKGVVDEARVAETVAAIQALTEAAQARYARFGSLGPAAAAGGALAYDRLLLREGFISRPFAAGIGTRCQVRLLNASGLSASEPVNDAPGAYDLDGNGRNDVVGANYVVEVVIFGVSVADAQALNDQIDGPAFGPGPNGAASKGRVIWAPTAPGVVHVYVARGR